MSFTFPSGGNTYIPSFEASGKLVVEYSRNPSEFALNQYVTITPVKRDTGFFLQLNAEQAARVINAGLNEFVWFDGNDAPDGNWATESFTFQKYLTTRYSFPFVLGYKMEKQADWKILASHAAIAAQDAMTARTLVVGTALSTAGNYDSGHSDTATNLGGGFWTAGTETNPIIKKTLMAAARKIHVDTLGRVGPRQLVLVIQPELADKMASSQEIHSYLARSQYALPQLKGDQADQNSLDLWGLPPQIAGIKVVVDDTVRVTNRKGATKAASYVYDKNQAVLIARKGGLVNEAAGGPNFSTIHLFMYEEMTVESKDDVDNRKHRGRVVEDYDVKIVAPTSGYLVTNTLS